MIKSPDFVKRYKEAKGKRISAKRLKLLFKSLPALIIIVIFFVASYIIKSTESSKTEEFSAIIDYINDPNNAKQYEEAEALNTENVALSASLENTLRAKDSVLSYPAPDSVLLNKLKEIGTSCGVDITVNSYSATTGTVSFETAVPNAASVSPFIAACSACGLFADVRYQGYESSGDNEYSIKLVCALMPNEAVANDGEVNVNE